MYKLTLENNEEYIGGDFYNSKWNSIPSIKIKELEYNIGDMILRLSGFEAYNHLLEFENIQNKGKRIRAVYIMGKKDNIITTYKFDFILQKIYRYLSENGKEYMGKSSSGWKVGLLGDTKEELV